jgi:tRNA pseudouridine38-40 synthase
MRIVLEVMYDGTQFSGSQIQGELPTVQLALDRALTTAFRTPLATYGASRTDEGVHALSNFYHIDIDAPLNFDMRYRLNAILPQGVAIKNVYTAAEDFNVRFHATSRLYRYRIYMAKNPFLHQRALLYPFTINEQALHETAAIIPQYTQFESFCKRNAQNHTFNCTIMESRWERHGEELHYLVRANRFLRGMVRGLVGTQLQAGRGKINTEGFRQIIEAKDCTRAHFDVTGNGLYLEEITYPDGTLTPLEFVR